MSKRVENKSIHDIYKKKYILVVALLFLVNTSTSANYLEKEQPKSFPSIALNVKYGAILPTHKFMKGDNLLGSPLYAFDSYAIKILWQNPGYTYWQKMYKVPYYGFGFSLSNFFNPGEVGYPVSLYGNIGFPVMRWEKLELYSDLQLGVAANWKGFNPETNPKNVIIGSFITAHIGIGMMLLYPISRYVDVGGGMDFLHFSNGATKLPNHGFNVLSPSFEFKYHINERPESRKIKPPKEPEWSDNLFFMAGFGKYQFTESTYTDKYWTMIGFSVIYYKQLANKFRLGTGTDINYLTGARVHPEKENTGIQGLENFTVGIGLHPELIIGRLSIIGSLGVYAYHVTNGDFKKIYQRLGVRYDFGNNLSFGVNIRSINFSVAEFLEFNVGYKVQRRAYRKNI